MIQLLINITETSAEIIRCDGLIKEIQIPVDQKKVNPKLGLICSTPSLLTIVKAVAEACEEASEKAVLLRRMTKLEKMVGDLAITRKEGG